MRVTSSDLETTMSTVIEIESDSSGEIAVPAKLLVEALKNFAEQPYIFYSRRKCARD